MTSSCSCPHIPGSTLRPQLPPSGLPHVTEIISSSTTSVPVLLCPPSTRDPLSPYLDSYRSILTDARGSGPVFLAQSARIILSETKFSTCSCQLSTVGPLPPSHLHIQNPSGKPVQLVLTPQVTSIKSALLPLVVGSVSPSKCYKCLCTSCAESQSSTLSTLTCWCPKIISLFYTLLFSTFSTQPCALHCRCYQHTFLLREWVYYLEGLNDHFRQIKLLHHWQRTDAITSFSPLHIIKAFLKGLFHF